MPRIDFKVSALINRPAQWKSKKERQQYYSAILNSAQIGELLPGYFDDLLELLAEHPAAEEKIGSGVAAFKVDVVPPYFGRGFYVIRTDGSIDDFSYRICLNGRPTTAQLTVRAMRNEIFPQIDEFRRASFLAGRAACAITWAPITNSEAEVDHAPPNRFADIISSFLSKKGIAKGDVETVTRDGGVTFSFVDRDLAGQWRAHHKRLAVLRLVSGQGHKMIHANDNSAAKRSAA